MHLINPAVQYHCIFPGTFPKIILHPGKERSPLNKHPWLFSGAVKKKDANLKEGDAVEIFSSTGVYLATGHYHDGSITARIFSFEQTELNKDFWKQKGMDVEEINIVDGSGLSPLNRITTHAQVEILKYAKNRNWFPLFCNSLPEFNGMKIKSGTIRGVKGFCGYHKAKDGREYIFSFLVNNYSGRTSPVVNKMYKVLDELK